MAQFNSLTDRVRQMLGGIVQQAPKTLSGIGNAALDAVSPNIRPAMKSAQILKQNVQAIPRLMPQFQQNARANPIPMKAFEGLAEATTLGMKDIKYRPSQNLGEKLAYGTGYTLGMLNPASPLGLTAKAIGKLPAVSQGIANVTSKFAPTIAQGGLKALGARGIVNAAQGIPYTAAYSALRTAGGKGNIADAPTDLAFDFGVGALPLVGGLAVASSKPLKGKLKQFFINSADLGGDYSFKEVKGKIVDIFDGIDTFVYKNKAGEWIVTEGRTGSQISRPQSTISKAIEDAKISMKLATERAGTTIQDQISKVEKTRGISPAYKQVTTQDFAGYKRVPTPEELRAKMAQDAQRATKAGTQATGGIDAVWNNDPTLKARIDKAFDTGDTATVQKLLPQVPEQYKANYVANTSQPKTPRTIKVVDQSRTQQPISSPVSGNVGTEAKASVGQTSQPILETAPLNKSIPQRGFAESVQTNKKTPAEIKPELEKIRYEPISNAETMAQADKIIQTDELKALDFAKNNADTTANSVSLKLIEKYLDQGRFSEANDLISAVAPRFTKAGQEIQILSTYGRLTPTGAIKYAQTLINQANKANPRLNLKLTEANTKIITEYANRVQSLPVGSRERIVATAQLMQKITDQVPPSIGQKIATIQTMMQLLNPKTAVRNIIGNTLFTGAENISDVLATGLDRVTGFITGRRSKVLPSITAQGRGFIKGGREGFQDAMLGIDTSGGVSSQFEIKGKTFTDPILGSLEKALNIELRVPDRAAYTAAFEGSLNNQMRAAGITKATPEMIEIAHADGLYRTFQDNSRLAQIFSGIKKTLNKIGTPDGRFGLGDFVLKYPKTPANILSRGLDYSPAGFVKGIYEGIRPFMTGQPFNQKQFVENLSRAMVGTGLISAGYILAKNGIISGKNDKDYDISSVKRTTGQGAFKLNASALSRFFQSGGQKQDDQNGDVLVSYDWAQPTSIQVAMGANSALGGNAEDMASIASDNLQAGVDTLTGQSMVKNLMDYAGGIKDKGFVGATQDMALNSATGFIPSVVRQTANVFDPLQRSTYAGTPAGVAINKAKATIPFVRNTLEPKLDVFGKEMPNYEGSGLQRLFDIFVNPAFVTKIQENPAAKEVIDIYQRSGLTTQAPRVADSKIKINGQDVKVSPQQYTQYQRYMGTKTDETFNALMNDPLFMKSSDEEKAKFLQGVLTDINSAAKIELFGNKPKTVPQDVKDVMKSSGDLTGRMLTLTKEGNLKMAMGDIEYPKLTGNTELDKKLITAYRGKITQKANEITAMYEAGEITAAQAETELNKLIELKSKVSTKKAKKAPKITVRKLSAPKVAKSARIKIKIPKLKKPKTLKLKKYTVKLSK